MPVGYNITPLQISTFQLGQKGCAYYQESAYLGCAYYESAQYIINNVGIILYKFESLYSDIT